MLRERRVLYHRRHTGLLCVSCDIRPGLKELIDILRSHFLSSLQITQTQLLVDVFQIFILASVFQAFIIPFVQSIGFGMIVPSFAPLFTRLGATEETQRFLCFFTFILLRPAAVNNFHYSRRPSLTTRRSERTSPLRWRRLRPKRYTAREARWSHGRDVSTMVPVLETTVAPCSSLHSPLLHHKGHSLFRSHVRRHAREWTFVRRPHAHRNRLAWLDGGGPE